MFTVSGKPFMPMGGQAHNSSAYNAAEIASAVAGVKALNGNTLIAPVYWDQIEPEEGRFDFSPLDSLLDECRKNDLHLILLWFATWKNGEMRYCPAWVKSNPVRFQRVLRADKAPMQVLSSFCRESMLADARAFQALLARLSAIDAERKTVLAVQVENEPGILASDRDYSPAAEAALRGAVPAELVEYLRHKGSGPEWEAWVKQGSREQGAWEELFGLHAGEFCTAWSVARYIDYVAAEGRKAYDILLYANVWLGFPGWPIPGFYPSGGAVWRAIDIWKCAAPHLDLIAPDIYSVNFNDFKQICAQYSRSDNPLFVPESGADAVNARNMLRAIADYHALGYFIFGVDSILDLEGNVRESAGLFVESFHCVMSLLPLLRKFHASGRIHSVVEEDYQVNQCVELERFIGAIPFINMGLSSEAKDHRHGRSPQLTEGRPKYGLIIEASPDEFYLTGNFHLFLVAKESPLWNDAIKMPLMMTPPDFLSVDEGALTSDGEFIPLRSRNGDEAVFGGFWASPYCGVVRVRMTPKS
jgi:beta-galactosidase GanA